MIRGITPFLWFQDQAEEAVDHYLSIFRNGRVLSASTRNGKVLLMSFELEGQKFQALNGGPIFQFTEAVSFLVNCETQEEVDHLWEKLSEGGQPGRCGWLKDKFGISWQIVPALLGQLMGDPNPRKAGAVMQAMMKMDKIILADLQRAYDQAA
ncbi:VOC family protein [Pseudacidobacterium ailaaui]|jgi:predicted 3-demethylubiquinone-9 3-methyltransferase (glyoxalase superfamily)|uniref:VOC family protein n=1 Tax=Pseudacidobacterium ailaaui TaxID=1382359 RepID=UPI00085983EE|nr:VOC family protein [Pseudacidobacterium ailaaui]MCL6464045.1 VOC family protein [Pseudacidobacterium ailaaui]